MFTSYLWYICKSRAGNEQLQQLLCTSVCWDVQGTTTTTWESCQSVAAVHHSLRVPLPLRLSLLLVSIHRRQRHNLRGSQGRKRQVFAHKLTTRLFTRRTKFLFLQNLTLVSIRRDICTSWLLLFICFSSSHFTTFLQLFTHISGYFSILHPVCLPVSVFKDKCMASTKVYFRSTVIWQLL